MPPEKCPRKPPPPHPSPIELPSRNRATLQEIGILSYI